MAMITTDRAMTPGQAIATKIPCRNSYAGVHHIRELRTKKLSIPFLLTASASPFFKCYNEQCCSLRRVKHRPRPSVCNRLDHNSGRAGPSRSYRGTFLLRRSHTWYLSKKEGGPFRVELRLCVLAYRRDHKPDSFLAVTRQGTSSHIDGRSSRGCGGSPHKPLSTGSRNRMASRCPNVRPIGSGPFIGWNLSYAVSATDRAKKKRCQGSASPSFGICPGRSGSVSVATFYSSDQRTALFHHLQNDKNKTEK